MIARAHPRGARIGRAALPIAVAALAVGILLRFPPEQFGFYPRCPFYSIFHLECPGCGATRALAALLRGDLAGAMRFNAFVTSLFPLMTLYLVVSYWRFLRAETFQWPTLPRTAVYAALVAAISFAVLRNLSQRFF
jgi:Protein of unknown function (DUF2752)